MLAAAPLRARVLARVKPGLVRLGGCTQRVTRQFAVCMVACHPVQVVVEQGKQLDTCCTVCTDLLGHPVSARPPTARYLAEFVARHRRDVTAATLVMLAVIGAS